VALPTIPDFPVTHHGRSVEKRCSASTSSSTSTSGSTVPAAGPTTPRSTATRRSSVSSSGSSLRLNKFVRRLHDMLVTEKDGGIVEWRRGLLVLYSTTAFTKQILPKYFNTKNFKTFRRQLNYYGFVHVRSFSATGSSTTALWINQDLAREEANEDVSAVLKLHRVEPNDAAKTVEGRRQRKEKALFTVEEDIGLNSKTLQLDQIRTMAIRGEVFGTDSDCVGATGNHLPSTPRSTVTPPVWKSMTSYGSAPQQQRQDRMGIPHEVHIPREERSLSIISDRNSSDEADPVSNERHAASSSTNLNSSAAAASMLLLLARS
jgi:HSF-type DNA-binding